MKVWDDAQRVSSSKSCPPSIECVLNQCEKCYINPEAHLTERFTEHNIDFTHESLGEEKVGYAMCQDQRDKNYKYRMLHHWSAHPPKVLPIWSQQLADVVLHQVMVWNMKDVVSSLTQIPNPLLSQSVVLLHFDYQQTWSSHRKA